MSIKKQLGSKIKRLRKTQGLTQEQLAEKIDLSLRTLSGIEIGENFVTADTLDRIISALRTTPEELFAVDHLDKSAQDLVDEIISDVESIKEQPEKLEDIYKVIKSLIKH